ncbi:MAG: hypothetical protein JO112_22825 [Planctomycetes bacterium]|nr:hypothetical protein [Planctomycetota bacterium]
MSTTRDSLPAAAPDKWVAWPVYWTAIWVGALTALAVGLIIGLIGLAVGAHEIGYRIVDWHKFHVGTLIFSVCGAFFAFVAGGWVAGKVAGILRSETAMLHGAIVWLLAVPLLLILAGVGAGGFYGSWYGGMGGTPSWAATARAATANPTGEMTAQEQEAAKVARNSALGTVTALLLGLIGAVIGGWMASGEPMTFTHYRTRHLGQRPGETYAANPETLVHR